MLFTKKSTILYILILSFAPYVKSLAADTEIKTNPSRILEHLQSLAKFGQNAPTYGVSRLAYSDEDRDGRAYVIDLMKDAGLDVNIDTAGNIIGKLIGLNPNSKPIVMGSHIDTVPEGGNYDGTAGSLSAIEVAQTIRDAHRVTNHPIEVIIFQNEEGGHLGSRAITSGLSDRDLSLHSLSGKSVREGIDFIGGKTSDIADAKLMSGDIAAYFELHVEQGGILDAKKINIGVVDGIVGIRRWMITFEGVANHAGATPMNMRHDSLLAAAKLIDATNSIVKKLGRHQVATAGKIEAFPGAPNVIAGLTRLTIETRDLQTKNIDAFTKKMTRAAEDIAKDTQTKVSIEKTYDTSPELTATALQKIIETSAKNLKDSSMHLPSGAGHDAQEMAKIGPMGMIFIPSAGGYSHSPKEFTEPDDISRGAEVLLHSVLQFDEQK